MDNKNPDPEPTQEPTTPVSTSQNTAAQTHLSSFLKNKKMIILAGIVLILTIFGGTTYFMNINQPNYEEVISKLPRIPTPTDFNPPTSTPLPPTTTLIPIPTLSPIWKTYNYSAGKLSFKYPDGWNVTPGGVADIVDIVRSEDRNKPYPYSKPLATIRVAVAGRDGLTGDEFLRKRFNYDDKELVFEDIIINGKNWKRFTNPPLHNKYMKTEEVYVLHGDLIYVIYLIYNDTADLTIFSPFLESIKFTN